MNWITGPNRVFGIGELKEQSAVIKVYSATELKNALTAIYKSSNTAATIQIAGDITISEPIKLKVIPANSKIKQIIIEGIAGAKIINGRPLTSSITSDLNTVFEFQYLDNTVYTAKYTFRNLIFNTATSLKFNSLIFFNLKSSATNPQFHNINIDNITLTNFNYIFNYNTNVPTQQLRLFNIFINNVNITGTTIYAPYNVYINRDSYLKLSYSYIANISTDVQATLILNDDSDTSITFANIACYLDTIPNPTNNYYGYNIVLGGTNAYTLPAADNWSYTGAENGNQIYAGLDRRAQFSTSLNIIGEAKSTLGPGDGLYPFKYIHPVEAISDDADTDDRKIWTPKFKPNCRYEIDWILNIKIGTQVNSYHIKTNVKSNGAGVPTIIGSSTIFADEEYIGIAGLTPVVYSFAGDNALYMEPVDSIGAAQVITQGSLELSGYIKI